MGSATSLSLHKGGPLSSGLAGEVLWSLPRPHDEAEQMEAVSSPLRQGGEATGSHPQNREARGATRSALDGESRGPGWQGVARIPTGPWRPSEDPRGASQIPGLTLRRLTSFPRQSSKGAMPCVRRGREEGPFRDLLSGAELGAQVPELEPDPPPLGLFGEWMTKNDSVVGVSRPHAAGVPLGRGDPATDAHSGAAT